MKPYFLIVITLLSSVIASAQTDKAPTQAELQKMMKDAQRQLDNLDPETKHIMDSLGIKMPDMKQKAKQLSGATDAQLKQAWEDDKRIVPKRNDAKIASISKTPLTSATMSSYILAVKKTAEASLLPKAKATSEELYNYVSSQYHSAAASGNCAATLWMTGKTQIAMYMMGKACADDPTNTDNLSNYASMLTSTGNAANAIPVLSYLNKTFPKNSTILNNIAQAWYALGDIAAAKRYCDSTLRLFAYHPQANMTLSYIYEYMGDPAEAAICVQNALHDSYTTERAQRLRELGKPITSKEILWCLPLADDGLHLGNFQHPPVPVTVADCYRFAPQWEAFREECNEEIQSLQLQIEKQQKIVDGIAKQREQNMMMVAGMAMQTLNPSLVMTDMMIPFYSEAATAKYKPVAERDLSNMIAEAKEFADFKEKNFIPAKKQYEADMAALRKRDNDQTGEGEPNEDFCPEYITRTNNYLSIVNKKSAEEFERKLELERVLLRHQVQWGQYMYWPEQFELLKLKVKQQWLEYLTDVWYEDLRVCDGKTGSDSATKLAQFDDTHCRYKSRLNLIWGTIETTCTEMKTSLKIGFFEGHMTHDMNKEDFGDAFKSGSVKLMGKLGGVDTEIGPLKLKAGVKAGVELQIGQNGIEDVNIIVEAKAGSSNMENDMIQEITMDKINLGYESKTEGRVSLVTGMVKVNGFDL